MKDEYVTQTEIGRIYGVNSRAVGKWLKDIGLRSPCGTPTNRAFNEGFADGRPGPQTGMVFYVWHREKTIQLLGKYPG